MMAASASGWEQLEKRSTEVLCPADASVPWSFAVDEIVEQPSRVNRGGSISDLPFDMVQIQIQDFGRFSKLKWGDDRREPVCCSWCGARDFQASSDAKSPSLAFLRSVWGTERMDNKDLKISKLVETRSYKRFRKLFDGDRACDDSSSDHVAARVQRPEPCYISGSQFLKVGKVNVHSWACVSFSCLSLKEIMTILSELRELMAPGMDISPEPTLLIHATIYSHHTDIKRGLLSAREFFRKQRNAEAKLLLVLHDAEYSAGDLDELCKDIEVYQSCRCSPKPQKRDLKNVASEVMLKVLDFKARKSLDGSSKLKESGELFLGEDTDGSYSNKNDIGAEEISEDKPSEKQQLHEEKSSTKKRKRADCDELYGAELIRDKEPQDANKGSISTVELFYNDLIFTPSIQCTCGHRLEAPPSSAFLLSVWRDEDEDEDETKLLDKKYSWLPRIDHLKLFDTTGDYKFVGKMPAEDRACPDSSSDHAESRNSTGGNCSEGRKRSEASHISGSGVRKTMRKESVFYQYFAAINYDKLEVRKVDVRSWACVSFSHRSVKEIFAGLSELAELMATGMDISLEPSLFFNATCTDYTDMEQAMLDACEFFCEQSKTKAKLLLILHDDECSYGNIHEFCEEFGVTYQYCCSQRLNTKYLKYIASEIMFKVLNFTALNSSVDRWDELMEDHASRRESYYKLFGDEYTDGSHDNKIDIGNEEICEGKPSEKQQLHVEKSLSKKRKHVDCEDLQEIEQMDEEPPVANKVKEGSVKRWACVCFAPLPESRIQKFSRKLRDKCVSIGMDFVWLPLLFVMKKPACPKDIEDCLWNAYEEFVDNYDLQCKLDLLTVILPQERDLHGKVEEVCKHMGVVCQYFWPISAILPINEYLMKAAQGIRDKVLLSGELQQIHKAIPLSEHTVVFGADISPLNHGIALSSVVASMNWPKASTYKLMVRRKQWFLGAPIADVEFLRELLHEFYEETMKRPERVIFFRHDVRGPPVSDDVYQHEIAAVIESCASMFNGLRPRITYMLVHEGRNEMTNKSKNIHPGAGAGEYGSAVQSGLAGKYDALRSGFDVAHTAEGTAHYSVILDDNEFTPLELKSICLNLCTPHHRWAYGDMPIVAPAYFASHGGTRARKSVLSTDREKYSDYFY